MSDILNEKVDAIMSVLDDADPEMADYLRTTVFPRLDAKAPAPAPSDAALAAARREGQQEGMAAIKRALVIAASEFGPLSEGAIEAFPFPDAPAPAAAVPDEVREIVDRLSEAEKAGDAAQVLAAYRAVRRAALARLDAEAGHD